MKNRVVWSFILLIAFAACSSNEAGGIRLHYAWTDAEGNTVTPPKMAQLYAWAELTYAGETKTAGPVWMGDDGNILRFENLPYGPKMKLTITMRLIDGAGGDEDLLEAPPAPKAGTDNIAYRCTSQEFSLVRGKVTDVQNGCIMEPSAGIDPETGDPTIPELKVFDLDGTELPLDREATKNLEVNLCYKAPNATQVHIANLSDFTGMKSVTIPEATGGVCPDGYHAYEGWKIEEPSTETDRAQRVVYLKASDDLGAETKAASVQFFVDNKAPVIVNQSVSPTAANGNSTVAIALSFQEPVKAVILDDGALNFQIPQNDDDTSPDPQLFVYEYQIGETDAEGTYPFEVTATDMVGNTATISLDDSLTIDKTLPDLTYTVEKNGTTMADATALYLKDADILSVSLVLSEAPKDTPRLNLGTYGLVCTADADTAAYDYDCTLTIDKDNLDEGIADLSASFEDAAGNPYAAPLKAGIRLDYTAPLLTLSKNKNTTYNKSNQILISVNSTEELSELIINGVPQSDLSDRTWDITPDTSDGEHLINATAKDLAGNEAIELQGSYFVDWTYPTATIGGFPANTARFPKVAAVNFTVASADINDPITVEVQQADGSWSPCTNGACKYTTAEGTAGSDTQETVTIRYSDAAGNTVTANAGTVYVDRKAPTFTFQKSKQGTYNATDQIVLTVTASEELSAVTLNGTAQSADTISWNITGVNTTGNHEVKAGGTDLAGNIAAEVVIGTYTVDADYPTATISDPSPERIAGGATATITLSDIAETLVVTLNGDTALCEKKGDNYECTYTAAINGGDEVKTLAIAYTDDAGNTSSITKTVEIDRTPPSLTIDLNDDAFNANETIRITVTASEELDGLPVTEIPTAAMTLSSPTQISSFSWLYTLDPTLLDDDDDYTVRAAASDTVAWEDVALSAPFSVDTSTPDLVPGQYGVDRPKAGIGVTYTVDFETSEPVVGTDGVPTVKANDITLTDCHQNGSDTLFRCTRTVGEEIDSTVYSITAALADAAGNSRTVTIGSIMADKTYPDAMTGTAILSIDAGPDCALTQAQVTTLANGSTAYLSVQVSEKLENGYTPVLTAKKTGAPDIVFDLDSQNGLAYYFSYLYEEAIPTAAMIGEYTLELTLKDEAGNETTVTVDPDKPFQTAWNDPELVIDQTVVTYTRSPWGRGVPYQIKDNDENVVYTIPANDYYEIGTNDLYAKTDRLPASAFTLDYGVATGAPAQLRAWDRDGNYLALAKNKPNGDGSWPRTRIYSYDSSEVFISAIDSSCRETEKVKILNVNWVASMNKKQASKPTANPHEYKTTRFFDARLGQAQRFLTEPEVYNPTDGLLTINTPTVFTATDYAWEQRSTGGTGKGLVYNEAREKLESAPWVREWNGANWTDFSNSPSTRDYSAFAYDIVRERVVQFGGGFDGMAMVGDMAYDDFYEMDVDGTWYSMTPATKPPARIGHGMAYDPARNKTVLFGGAFGSVDESSFEFQGAVYYRDTWEWDGTNWTQRTGDTCTGEDCYVCEATTCPPFVYIMDPNWMGGGGGLQARHAMVYDERREKILLVVRDKTWVWDGVVWSERPASLSGNGNSFPTMTYDRLSGKILLFRKHKWSSPSETWEWDGSAWTQITPVVNAPADYYGVPSLAYDPVYEESILIGSGTWAWRGTGHDLPAQIFTVAMDHSKISEYTGVTFRSVTANFDTGGIGDVAGAATDGATLLFWHDDEWYDIATNEAGIAEALPLQKNIANDETDLQTLLDANGNTISFAVTPTAPRGFGTVTGEVATDYAEVIVRYTISE